MPELVVLIATAGRPDLLARTLASLEDCLKPAGYRATVIVENGSRQGAEDVCRRFQQSLNCQYMFVAEGNKSLALNEAVATLGDCLIFFSDDDVRYERQVLVRYAAAAEGTRSGEYYGGPTDVDYEHVPAEWVKRHLPVSARGWSPSEGTSEDDLYFLGFNWAAFAADIRRLGGFDGNRGPGAKSGSTGQETEMQRRLRASGARPVYVPGALVWHYIPRDRSSPQWTIERAYRNGIARGMETAANSAAVFGLPIWVVVRLFTVTLRSASACLTTNPEKRFEAAVKRSYNRGLVAAARLKRQVAPEQIDGC